MRILFIALAALLLPTLVFADQGSIVTYTSLDWQFTMALPGGGVISDAYSDPEWSQDDSTVFSWVSLKDKDPVFLVMASALQLDTDATDKDIADFVQGMTSDETATKTKTEVQNVSDAFDLGGRSWVSALFKDNNADSPGQFEAFVTRQGPYIYAIVFHYTDGVDGGNALAKDVLTTFTTH